MTAYDALLWFNQVGWRTEVYCLPADFDEFGHNGAVSNYASDLDRVLGAFVRTAKKRAELLKGPCHAREAAEMALELLVQGKPVYPALRFSMLRNVPLKPLTWKPNSEGLAKRLSNSHVSGCFQMTYVSHVGMRLRRYWPRAFELPQAPIQLALLS